MVVHSWLGIMVQYDASPEMMVLHSWLDDGTV